MTARTVVPMTLDGAERYTPEERAAIAAVYPEHKRDARVKGMVGPGFPVAEDQIVCEPIAVPEHWPQISGLDFMWFDEEPPLDVYIEGLTRINATGGMAYLTFTPLLEMSEVVSLFLQGAGPQYEIKE